jgi:glycosyltransferase involved in cell wall biosynthesis
MCNFGQSFRRCGNHYTVQNKIKSRNAIMTSTNPIISIIVPIYGVEAYLRQCLDSIRNQTFTQWEAILIDDGSPDRCGAICDEYAATDNRFKVIHQPNKGRGESRNTALHAAQAPYIGFVDADDWVEPEMFEQLYNAITANNVDIAMCNFCFDYKDCRNLPRLTLSDTPCSYTREQAVHYLIEDRVMHSYLWDKLFRRELISHDFPVHQNFEDLFALLKWFTNMEKLCFIPYVGYHYRQRQGSAVHDASLNSMMQYISARIEQLKFLQSEGLLRSNWEKYETDIVKDCLKQARNLARELPWSEELASSLSQLTAMIEPYESTARRNLNSKFRKRLHRIRNHPRFFARMVSIERRFRFSNYTNKAQHTYFE